MASEFFRSSIFVFKRCETNPVELQFREPAARAHLLGQFREFGLAYSFALARVEPESTSRNLLRRTFVLYFALVISRVLQFFTEARVMASALVPVHPKP
jgi:hypothetical protein